MATTTRSTRPGPRSRTRMFGLVLVAVLLAVVVGGCAGGTDHDDISAVLVQGKAGFAPARLTVHTGDKVTLELHNYTASKHGFDIDGYGLKPRVIDPATAPPHVRFTAHRAGTFRIFCHLHPTHQPATLVVL